MHIVPFEAEHISGLQLQPAQRKFGDALNPEYARALASAGNGWTAVVDGVPVACAGLVEQWEGRALAWALLSDNIGPSRFVRVTRAVRRFLDMADYRRIEMQVDADHAQAIRWAEMLGFEVESKKRAFLPDGRDAFEFVRIR